MDGGEGDAAIKTDASKTDAGNKQDSSQQQQCVSQCATDDDCANSCPQVPNGVNCCDTSTGICYAYSASSCPAPVADAGFD